ncbi:3-(3-hydroxyphenyl)propionate hydroxylase [Kineosporia sp. NBRC 101677]|uniref:bifunctional 3-(3-hydroxy-phenyl)propionate/3-hydroxycinnamic acid hydroxylase n=1 Tax=Kineosporia sp. NBRC 101677 TaxID=3032197 RepID=UPI0024A57D5E|nr:bifunctional 3-(3-hydroxy-phenyl)propionate/3-hydroxycinnamic acid hydroxylase [Kineosporia sp. NBRC 101677]GLY18368.1 3-(3-hydroxyphenyl)propionate hydroxylase [Kineosporia sp. NBRC 101677]
MVIIVGAGPAGMVTALLLARQGVQVLLLERHHRPYPLPRAVHLDDECVRILQSAGVAAEFVRISRPAAGLRLLDARHEPLAEFRRSETVGAHGYPQANLFDQPALEEILLKAVSQDPLIELRRGVTVTGVEGGGAGADCRVHWVRTSSSDELGAAEVGAGVLAAEAVVGCDGAGSLVRSAIGSRFRTLAPDQTWFVLDVLGPAPVRPWDGVEQICDPARPATYLRVGEQRLRWEFRMRPGETIDELTERRAELVAPWLGPSRHAVHAVHATHAVTHQVLRTAEYTFRAAVADRWRRDRVFLVGDAAHLTPPFIGQGLGSGLRDAANLSWKLAMVLRGAANDRLLDSYQAERAPHATTLIRLAALAGGLMSSPVAARLGPVLRAAGRSEKLTSRILAGTSPPLRSGPLAPRRPAFRSLVGTLVPNFGVGPDTRLDDLLGTGFALLTRREDVPADGLRAGLGAGLGAQLGARVVRAGGLPLVRQWLDAQDLDFVLLRPDRVILAVGSGRSRDASRPAV